MAAACLGVVALLVPVAGAQAEAPDVSVRLEPVPHGGTATVLTQVARANPEDPERWILNPIWSITNRSGDDLTLTRTELEVGGYTDKRFSLGLKIPAGEEVLVPAAEYSRDTPHNFQGEMPHPDTATWALKFLGYDDKVVGSSGLKVHRHETPSGAYHFPMKATDLPPGAYWTNANENQDNTAHHYEGSVGQTSQAYAYDIVAQRWTGPPDSSASCPTLSGSDADWDCEWTTLTESGVDKEATQANSSVKEDHLAWSMPVYAMDSGTVLGCRRNQPDLDDNSDSGTADSNRLWIAHGPGEYALYTHLKQGSSPDEVCASGKTVHAGQQIGAIGNNGSTSAPHLHVHLSRRPPKNINDQGGPGLPLMFDRFETGQWVQPNTLGRWVVQVENPELSPVPDDTPRALPRAGIVKPYPCGWATPDPAAHTATQFNVPDECVDEISEDLIENGQRPVAIDGMTVAGATSYNLINRSGPPQTRVGSDLTPKQLQARLDQLARTSFRPIHIDNYVRDGQLRFAAVWAKLGGPLRSTYYGLTQAEHDARLGQLGKDGYQPLVVSATTAPGGRRYSAIYEQRDVGSFFTGVTPVSEMQAKADELAANGLGPVHFDGFDIDGSAHISQTWHRAASGTWAALADLDQSTLEQKTAELFDQGWFTTSATGYDAGGVTRFAAIWRPSP